MALERAKDATTSIIGGMLEALRLLPLPWRRKEGGVR
jgi:hypothetical protein